MKPSIPPRCASRFRVIKELGAGGQGTVYLALQLTLQREVALKVLTCDDPGFLARFVLEARIAAQLDHPNVVAVIDHDVEDGRPWIAYEYVPGPSLRARLAEGVLPWNPAARIAAGVARGLGAAHAIGAIHRDVKPENVLLAESGPRLADFGLARVTSGPGLGTLPGVLLGTPAYMAPELVMGEKASPAADIYALGVTIYEMLTGKPPFDSDQPVSLLRAHLDERVPDARDSGADVPLPLHVLISRCLSKDKSARPASALELAEQLTAMVDAAVQRRKPAPTLLVTRPSDPGKKASRAPAPRRSHRAIAAAIGAGLAVGLVVAAIDRTNAPAPAASVVASPASGDPASARPRESPATIAALAPLEARIALASQRVEQITVRSRNWEIELAANFGEATDLTVIKSALAELAQEVDGMAALSRELRSLGEAAPDSIAVEARRAQVAGLRFDAWFWSVWLAQYVRSGHAGLSPAEVLSLEKLAPSGGGAVLFREFSRRLYALAERAAADPALLDDRVAEGLFQTACAFRFMRTRGDPRFREEAGLHEDMRLWVGALTHLREPMGPDLAAAIKLLSDSLVVSGDSRKLRPKIEAHLARAARRFPAARGWTHLLKLAGKPPAR